MSEPAPRTTDEIARLRALVEANLLRALGKNVCAIPERLREAMEYSLTAGGKRMRPVILLSAGRAVGGSEEMLLPFACALEYVHTYSLIHDDLPAMDDDDFRRGRPTCHKVFGEATAILAGDALLTEAFRAMAESDLAAAFPARALRAVAALARGAGAEGMVGGQELDLSGEAGAPDPSERAEEIRRRKTAALIEASARMGGILGGGDARAVGDLSRYGLLLGHLFQITDDILDETGTFEEMGKGVAKDRARGKLTATVVHGVDGARARADALAAEAASAIARFGGEADALRDIVRRVSDRRS